VYGLRVDTPCTNIKSFRLALMSGNALACLRKVGRGNNAKLIDWLVLVPELSIFRHFFDCLCWQLLRTALDRGTDVERISAYRGYSKLRTRTALGPYGRASP
jgi:hypothetical protein